MKARKETQVVLIDKDESVSALLANALLPLGIDLLTARTGHEGLAIVQHAAPKLVLLDHHLPDAADGFSFLEKLVGLNAATEVVILSSDHSIESTVEAVKRGALDYVTKPLHLHNFVQRFQKWLSLSGAAFGSGVEQTRLLDLARTAGLIGRSGLLVKLVSKIDKIGPHFRNALITGPTGSGKELVAKLLHRVSGRSGPFVVFNCAAVPESLFESELFGHAKGAFTGATRHRIGMAAHASGGTLFIDEVADLPLRMQAALLRLVQSREIKRLGSYVATDLDIRIIAASNRDLRQMVEEGTFREDLYHRLSTVEITIPGLCDRREDIPVLIDHFLTTLGARYARPGKWITSGARMAMMSYPWPGNVRELESVIDYCCLMCPTDRIDASDLPEFVRSGQAAPSSPFMSLEEMELRHLNDVLQFHAGNREEAAALLGIGRATVYRMLTKRKVSAAIPPARIRIR